MVQTNDALSSKDVDVEIYVDSTGDTAPTLDADYTDICGFSTSVEPDEQTRQTGTTMTLCGDTAIITTGKREPVGVAFNFVYTENDVDAFKVVRDAHEAGYRVWVRWFPKGRASGNKEFRVENVPIAGFTDPPADAGSADPLLASFNIMAPSIIFENHTPLG